MNIDKIKNTMATISAPYTEAEYQGRVALLNQLLDEIGGDKNHPLISFLNELDAVIESYEQEHYPVPESTPAGVLRYLMEEHQLKQSDLPEIGSQGIVSEILNGKRELNKRQIQALSQRFGVSLEVFF